MTIDVNDELVNNTAKKSGASDDELDQFLGFFDQKSKTAYFKSSVGSSTLSEEIFHGLQFYMNKKEKNNQNISDIEAEAKLFNADVIEEEAFSIAESEGSVVITSGITSGAESDIFLVKMAQSETGSKIIESGENKNAYDSYVDSFYNFYKSINNNHVYARQAPTKAVPVTYNKVQKISKKKTPAMRGRHKN